MLLLPQSQLPLFPVEGRLLPEANLVQILLLKLLVVKPMQISILLLTADCLNVASDGPVVMLVLFNHMMQTCQLESFILRGKLR
jgi:hypothetical protein